jgi:hypothetical protein
VRTLELAAAAFFLLLGLRAAATPARIVGTGLDGRDRVLIALHDAARAGFWFALGGLFLGFGLMDDARSFQWFVIVPISMAAVRMLAAVRLARR